MPYSLLETKVYLYDPRKFTRSDVVALLEYLYSTQSDFKNKYQHTLIDLFGNPDATITLTADDTTYTVECNLNDKYRITITPKDNGDGFLVDIDKIDITGTTKTITTTVPQTEEESKEPKWKWRDPVYTSPYERETYYDKYTYLNYKYAVEENNTSSNVVTTTEEVKNYTYTSEYDIHIDAAVIQNSLGIYKL